VEVIEVEDQYYILAKSALADDRTSVLKHGDTFAIFDRYGDIQPIGLGEQGIFHEGTRFLSKLILNFGAKRPMLLSSTVRADNVLLSVDLTNPDVYVDGLVVLPRGTLHIYRSKFLWESVCYERLRFRNYGLQPVDVTFSLRFENDFADIFEVRGQKREQRGRALADTLDPSVVVLAYEGLDGIVRRTRIECSPPPQQLTRSDMTIHVHLEAHEETGYLITFACELNDEQLRPCPYERALAHSSRCLHEQQERACSIFTANEQFNQWLNRSSADLQMMITATSSGPYPYAGVPWFSTVFGRDGIITALEYLWVDPELARGVLAYLAATQATEILPEQDAEPGKVLHETRTGEMAQLGEVPFRRYYGSIDATPLFVMLAAEYYERTGDLDFLRSLWPNLELALAWMDKFGDQDGDGFVEYFRRSAKGLVQQGWKDSQDSVFHADGTLAEGPIALCEVQGYVYAAKLGIAVVAGALGKHDRAQELRLQAEALRDRFEAAFWCEDVATYAIALDGEKRPCKVRTSNPGHCLFTGIASEERAQRTADTLLNSDSFSGWGIRTVATSEKRFNPMSYHNGSIWPHDNAMIAQGLARYGRRELAAKVLSGIFDVSTYVELQRLPELFCGFVRRPGKGPTLYPVACSPQAWAAGAVFMFLQASLGLRVHARTRQIHLMHPLLPESLERVEVCNLRLNDSSVDLVLERYGDVVGVHIKKREGDVEIVTVT
jgi:glycogen debranching enzyme